MFEVDWTDYEIERVGQRRARKEIEKDLKKNDNGHSVRDSVSTRSSVSAGDKPSGFLGSLAQKFNTSSSKSRKTLSNTLHLPTDIHGSKRGSILSQAATATQAGSTKDFVAIPSDNWNGPLPQVGVTHRSCPTAPSDKSTNRSSKGTYS